MKIEDIVAGINSKLAGERYGYAKFVPYLDSVIDEINRHLNSKFPAFSELPKGTLEYDCFPDRYIRSVVVFGAAYYHYQTDEEGIDSAQAYAIKYQENLFYMLRDYAMLVPEKYQDDCAQGSFVADPTLAVGPGAFTWL